MVDRPTLDAAKAASTGQLLLKAARLLDEQALARIRAVPGAPPVRPAHTRLFPHIDRDGVRATTLAARLGVSKQAVAALVADLVAWELVEQVPDPDDGRARLIRWTPHGLEALMHGLSVLMTIEAEVAERIGGEKLEAFREGLVAVLEVLEGGEQGARYSQRARA